MDHARDRPLRARGHPPADADEKLDNCSPTMGVALVGPTEPCLNYRVQVVIDLVSSHAASLLSWALTAIAINMMAHSHGDGGATKRVTRSGRGLAGRR